MTCTNTLAAFPNLAHVTLHASVGMDVLYPAVLVGMRNLQRLQLINYPGELNLETA